MHVVQHRGHVGGVVIAAVVVVAGSLVEARGRVLEAELPAREGRRRGHALGSPEPGAAQAAEGAVVEDLGVPGVEGVAGAADAAAQPQGTLCPRPLRTACAMPGNYDQAGRS